MLSGIWSKGNIHILLVGMQTSTATMEISVMVLQEGGSWYTSTYNSWTYIQSVIHLSIETLLSLVCWCSIRILRNWKCSSWPSTDEYIKKMWCIYILDYCLSAKRGIKKSWIFRTETGNRKGHCGWGKPDWERQMVYVFIYMWMVAVNSTICVAMCLI